MGVLMEELESRFDSAVKKWKSHCRDQEVLFGSSSETVRDCDAYREIVSMGHSSLPLIRKLYDENSQNNLALEIIQAHGLTSAVRDIAGDDFTIPESIRGKVDAIKSYTKKWLDENKYWTKEEVERVKERSKDLDWFFKDSK